MNQTNMLLRYALTLVLLTSTTFAVGLKDYADYQTIPDWADLAFEALLKAEVISGTDAGELNPNATINRAEFLKILLEATDQDLISPPVGQFKDVGPQQWFYRYVESAAALGWVQGYPDSTFKPGNSINRAEIAKLINEAFDIPIPRSKIDAPWYDAHVEALSSNNLLPFNISQYQFSPDRNPSRAEAFEQMYRALQFKYNQAPANTNPTSVSGTGGEQSGYDVPANFSLTMAVTPTAGRLDLKRPDGQAKSVQVTRGQTGVTVAQLEMVARGGPVELRDLQFRRIGNGSVNDFAALWIELSNQPISPKQTPGNDLVSIAFNDPLMLPANKITLLNLKADITSNAALGASERFVLYLPNWINANTNQKIGLFPLGGSNIEIR